MLLNVVNRTNQFTLTAVFLHHSGDNLAIGLLIGGSQRASLTLGQVYIITTLKEIRASVTAIVLAHTRYTTVHAVIEHQVRPHYSTFAGTINMRRENPAEAGPP